MTAWKGLRHEEHGGITLVPDVPLPALEARGWEPIDTPEGVDPTDPVALRAAFDAQAEQERAAGEAEKLKGKKLDDALDKAGIPKAGLTANEKRAALAEHQAGLPAATDNENEGAE